MPDWLVVYFPLLVFAVLVPAFWFFEYRRQRRKSRQRAQEAGQQGPPAGR